MKRVIRNKREKSLLIKSCNWICVTDCIQKQGHKIDKNDFEISQTDAYSALQAVDLQESFIFSGKKSFESFPKCILI